MINYFFIFVLLLWAELIYFRIADRFNIIDKPNERSSHSTIVLRGGGIIFLIGAWVWTLGKMPKSIEKELDLKALFNLSQQQEVVAIALDGLQNL